MMGLYAFQHQESKLRGFSGFLLVIIGIAVIQTRGIEGINMYAIGALIFAAGLIALAIGSWMANKLLRWIPVVWVLSTIIGFVGYFVPGFSLLFVTSGVLFGVGFAGADLRAWSVTSK
jgi:Zn-dependent protease with chaperone function